MIDEVMMLRHGRTQYNLEHRLQGQIDVPLDIVGQWQVDQTGFALASRYYWAKVNRLASHPEAIAQPDRMPRNVPIFINMRKLRQPAGAWWY